MKILPTLLWLREQMSSVSYVHMQGGYQEENETEQIVKVVLVSRPGPWNKIMHVPPGLLPLRHRGSFCGQSLGILLGFTQ